MKTRKFVIAALLALCGPAVLAAPRVIVSAYKFLPVNAAPDNVIGARDATPYLAGKPAALTWAFATGECGSEAWRAQGGAQVASANVAAFAKAGVDYIISTGGQGGVFTCATDEAMERFIARYDSKHLAGIDFDIEAEQTKEQIASMVQRAAAAQKKRPHLRFSFTVGTHAASDGSGRSLNALGETILAAVRASTLKDWTFNLMVMDYGPPAADVCVLRGDVCDMGRSAVQAVRNVHAKYGIPLAQIEVTPMIGVNDVPRNDFTLDDARMLGMAVREMGLAGLHWWSLDRDRPCEVPVQGASDRCSGMSGPAGAFDAAFRTGFAGGR
ncbi:glycosyl hydrolase [Massilia dura]|uniref:Glycosyl hydrolase n=1 Tax=Pseudoduganella dura TaxID=321982 RepID=A0A6I3XG61_9BURK|nr:glycosyl hydrolase [Pseudoduganella dura]MUI12232.1 glycosyl hydrolase [Pseudoduganella dura]GGY06174.1 chitinase [Pseudoduganella dura]